MKKVITTVLLLLCVALMLCACSSEYTNLETLSTTGQNEESEHNNELEIGSQTEQSSETESDTVIISPDVEHLNLTIVTMEEYTKLLNSKVLPANFVPYEAISPLGEFKSLVILLYGDYSHYMYVLRDASGHELNLYVKANETEVSGSAATPVTKVNSTDMRFLPNNASERLTTFTTGGLVYKYVSGELLSIVWFENGIRFTLCGSMFLSEYPYTTSTVVGKLMNANDAAHVLGEIFTITENN